MTSDQVQPTSDPFEQPPWPQASSQPPISGGSGPGGGLRAFWQQHRVAVSIGAVLVLAAIALAAYLHFKKPGDVSNPDAPFAAKKVKPTNGLIDWPLYGGNPQRTRFLPAPGVKPPFHRDWSYDTGELMEYSPIYAHGEIYGINNVGRAFALDIQNGKPIWERKVAAVNASAPAYSQGRLYIVNLEPGQVLALRAKDGKTVWKKELPDKSESSPVTFGNLVIFGCANGTLYALNKFTGKVKWQAQMGGPVKAAPALDKGMLYVADYASHITAVRAATGKVKWQSSGQSLGLGQTGRFYGTPAVAFGRVYDGNVDGRMYSFVASNGQLAWSHSTGAYIYAAPAVADTPGTPPTVYFGGFDANVYALDAKSGDPRWVKPAGGGVSGAGSVIGNVFYVANLRRTATIGFDVKTGKRVYRNPSGAYNPVISDGIRIYLTGYSEIAALKPITPAQAKQEKAAKKKSKKGKGKN